jgi:hypothetical protein
LEEKYLHDLLPAEERPLRGSRGLSRADPCRIVDMSCPEHQLSEEE